MVCSYCNEKITSGNYIIDFWGNYYHSMHLKHSVECNFCGRILPSGFKLCPICSKNRIIKSSQIPDYYTKIVKFMKTLGFDISKYKVDIILMSNKKITPKIEEPGFINFKIIKSQNKIESINFTIYIKEGMPEEYFLETLTHELMHQWLILFAHDKMKPKLAEGSCNYMTYLYIKSIKTPLSYYIINRLLKDPHPHYGKGFRKVLKYANNNGLVKLRKYLESHKTI